MDASEQCEDEMLDVIWWEIFEIRHNEGFKATPGDEENTEILDLRNQINRDGKGIEGVLPTQKPAFGVRPRLGVRYVQKSRDCGDKLHWMRRNEKVQFVMETMRFCVSGNKG
jgi:hypothetical protein